MNDASRQSSKRLSQNAKNIENKAPEDQKDTTVTDKPTPKESNISTSGWIRKFCKRPGNEWLEEIERDFLNDLTNLIGLEEYISYMSLGLHAIMSDGLYLDSNGISRIHSKTEGKYLEAAETLYGLIHVRYLFTNKGFAKVLQNYTDGKYGMCPRHYCIKSSVLPIGVSDKIGQGNVKVYCPSCDDIYHPSLPKAPDGAYFGMNLPQMFFMTYPRLRPQPSIGQYVATIRGFRIHCSAYLEQCGPKETNKMDKHKSISKYSKAKRKDKLDDLKENDAAQDNKLTKLPQLDQGQDPPETKKSPRRRRHKRNKEIEVE